MKIENPDDLKGPGFTLRKYFILRQFRLSMPKIEKTCPIFETFELKF